MSDLEPLDRAERKVEEELSAVLTPLTAPRLSVDFEARLRARLTAERNPARARLRRVMRWYWGLGLAAAGATLVHALLIQGPGETGARAFTALAVLIATLELLPGRRAVPLIELVRRTLR